jgi:hypothetical protein
MFSYIMKIKAVDIGVCVGCDIPSEKHLVGKITDLSATCFCSQRKYSSGSD